MYYEYLFVLKYVCTFAYVQTYVRILHQCDFYFRKVNGVSLDCVAFINICIDLIKDINFVSCILIQTNIHNT